MNKTNLQKRILLAIFLSINFFILWELLVVIPNKKNEIKDITATLEDIDNKNEIVVAPQKVAKRQAIAAKTIELDNEYMAGSLNTRGLKLDNIKLKKYKEKIGDDAPVQLLKNNGPDDFYSVNIGWINNGAVANMPDDNTVWRSDKDVLKAGDEITFSHDNGLGVIFKVKLALDDKYLFTVAQEIENRRGEVIKLQPYIELQKKNATGTNHQFLQQQLIGVFKNKLEEIKLKKLKKRNYEFSEAVAWSAITDKYWLTALINTEDNKARVNFLNKNDVLKLQYFSAEPLTVRQNESKTFSNGLFVGAKDLTILDEYAEKYSIKLFDRAVDFGNLYFLTKPLYRVLMLFHNMLGNFGYAILLLTLVVKMLLYPINKKSFVSMAKMKKVQPTIKKLQEKYKNDKLSLNREMVKLYKKENISPLSGCLPLLLQIPVFFALYRVFVVSLAMRQAPFIGYIKDLSVADPTSIFNLFGLLPYEASFRLGFLPCLMALTMWLQNKMNDQNTSPDDPMATATKYMPLFFLITFASFPAGLLLYWTASNILSLLQQWWINRSLKEGGSRN